MSGEDYEWPAKLVTHKLGVRVDRWLGGRANQHWLAWRDGRPVVVRRYQPEPLGAIDYELTVLRRLDALGWPVPTAVTEPAEIDGRVWCAFRWLPGTAPQGPELSTRQRALGRLLARLHADLDSLADLGQRAGCALAEEIVADPELEHGLRTYERWFPDQAHVLRWHADRARARFAEHDLSRRPLLVLHGDFNSRNLLYDGDQLTGIIDFEATHLNHRASEFALSWRGKRDDVVRGYAEVSQLDEVDYALLAPTLWAWAFLGVATTLRRMATGEIEPQPFDWQVGTLLRRTPLMGADRAPYPGRS